MLKPVELHEAESHPEDVPVVTHSKRPAWGVGVLAWRTKQKLGVQFEDGRFRKFRREYEHMFTPAELTTPERVLAVEMLLEAIGEREATESFTTASAGSIVAHGEVVSAQIALLSTEFSGAFSGDAWLKTQRGEQADRRIKAHIDAATEDASTSLAKAAIEPLVESDPAAIWHRAFELIHATDFVMASEIRAFEDLSPEQAATMGAALYQRLHGDKSERGRFVRFCRAGESVLGKPMGWGMATIWPALVDPEVDMVVRPTVARAFLKLLDVDIRLGKKARYPAYRRYRTLMLEVKSRLEASELKPADLLDIHRFMRITLAPRMRESLEEFMVQPTPAPAPAA